MHIDNIDLEHFPTNEVAQRLLTYVTRGWYDKSYVGKWIYEVIGLELETASRRISEAQKQAFPETAAWGMFFHELMYGIPIDRTKDIDDRRKAVVNRRDRTARSSITPYRLENIIQTVFGLSASVSEQVEKYIFNVDLLIGADYPIYSVDILLGYIRKIKPSHLSMQARYVIEAAICSERERTLFPALDIGMQHVWTERFSVPSVEVKCEITEKLPVGMTGNVMIYKNLNQWNGEYKWDGTIKFDTEVTTEEL